MKRLFALLLVIGTPLTAQVRPSPGQGDPRLQIVPYDPNQVVELSVGPGIQLMIQFSAGERIETIALGDSSAWQVTPGKRGDFLFVKNLQSTKLTNMTVVTDARSYQFSLDAGENATSLSAYTVRFAYPAAQTVSAPPPSPQYLYKISGARAIRPSRVYQSGNQTLIEWPDDKQMPAVFAIIDGAEALINGQMQDGHYVVPGNPVQLIFRLDRDIASAVRKRVREKRP